jgi:O-antigen ligase
MNNLSFYNKKWLIVLILAIGLSSMVLWGPGNYLLFGSLLLLFFLIFLFFLKPMFGVYLIILFIPVLGFSFNFKFLEAPFIDLLSLLVLSSFIIRHIYIYFFHKGKEKLVFPFAGPFLFFFLAAVFSGLLSDDMFRYVWYSFRWLMFFYLAFIVLPFNVIRNKNQLRNSLLIFSVGGFFVALMGFASLFFQDLSESFFRVKPLFIFGDWIFGDNYNLLAEFLVISIFIFLSLKYWFKSIKEKRLINVFVVFLVLANLLTFGRTAWITISIQFIIYLSIEFIFIKKARISFKNILLSLFLVAVLIAPFFSRMIMLQEENVSSTQNRVLLTGIAWKSFLEKPLLGHGSGSFYFLVGKNIRFTAQYGNPIDSHGFGQKILSENGIIGTLAFLIFLFLIFRKLYLGVLSNKKDYKLLLPLFVASFGGYFYQIFNTSYFKGRIWIPIALALIALEIIERGKNDKNENLNKDLKNDKKQ